MEKTKQEKAIQAVYVICQSAKMNIVNTEEVDEGLTPHLEKMASAVQKHFGLEESVMDDYRKEIDYFRGEWEDAEIKHITHEQAEETREIVYEMCDSLGSTEEIMRHVRTIAEMLFVWNPLLVS